MAVCPTGQTNIYKQSQYKCNECCVVTLFSSTSLLFVFLEVGELLLAILGAGDVVLAVLGAGDIALAVHGAREPRTRNPGRRVGADHGRFVNLVLDLIIEEFEVVEVVLEDLRVVLIHDTINFGENVIELV